MIHLASWKLNGPTCVRMCVTQLYLQQEMLHENFCFPFFWCLNAYWWLINSVCQAKMDGGDSGERFDKEI